MCPIKFPIKTQLVRSGLLLGGCSWCGPPTPGTPSRINLAPGQALAKDGPCYLQEYHCTTMESVQNTIPYQYWGFMTKNDIWPQNSNSRFLNFQSRWKYLVWKSSNESTCKLCSLKISLNTCKGPIGQVLRAVQLVSGRKKIKKNKKKFLVMSD